MAAFALHAAERTILFVDDEDVLYRPGTLKQVVELKKFSPDKDTLWRGVKLKEKADGAGVKCVLRIEESADQSVPTPEQFLLEQPTAK
jgi:hypothetical protein